MGRYPGGVFLTNLPSSSYFSTTQFAVFNAVARFHIVLGLHIHFRLFAIVTFFNLALLPDPRFFGPPDLYQKFPHYNLSRIYCCIVASPIALIMVSPFIFNRLSIVNVDS